MARPADGLRLVPASRSGEEHHPIDITDPSSVQHVVKDVRPDVVIHTAALTSVDGCEAAPDEAHRVHVDGTSHLLEACDRVGAQLVSLSSNYIFDGREGPYAESDEPHPLNVYGGSKLAGEKLVLASGTGIVVRTAVLYGYTAGAHDNFVTWAVGELASGRPVQVVTDEWANPTFADELADFLLHLTALPPTNDLEKRLFHFAGADFLTRYEMVQAVCREFQLNPDLVAPITSAELAQTAERPLRAGLKTARAEAVFPRSLSPFAHNLQLLRGRIPNPASSTSA